LCGKADAGFQSFWRGIFYPASNDQRAIVANDVRELRSQIAMRDQRRKAGTASAAARNGEAESSSPLETPEPKERPSPPISGALSRNPHNVDRHRPL
jgi:hypothetical protein